jgi:cell division protein FtsI (penicillin-binding protein 3)
VLLIMVLLTTGLVATLWLSTAAAADSYRLDDARQATRDRSEEVERLHRDVAAMQSAPALAAAAQRIGMVPAGVPAVILVHPDGTSQVVGTPAKARAAAPSPAPAARPAAPTTPGTAPPSGAPDPEALANDPRSGVQASSGGTPAPAPAGAGTTGATRSPGAAIGPTTPATPGGR